MHKHQENKTQHLHNEHCHPSNDNVQMPQHSHDTKRHTHTPEETKAVLDRLARASGHLEHVRRMVADGKDCSDILVQLSAVRSAINKTGLLILQSHIEHCIVDAVASGDMEAVKELNHAISRYLK